MRSWLWLAACWLSLVGSGAIVTERNNVFTYAPNYATFPDGISQSYIPFGTFTDGIGSTEYLRVTSNLTGVVASAFDGFFERWYVPNEGFILTNMHEMVILTPLSAIFDFQPFRDNGEFLISPTNNSLRILDHINETYFINCMSNSDHTFYYSPRYVGQIENELARETYFNSVSYHDGFIKDYGSRRLDDLVAESGASIDPPIPTSWTTALPFRAADSNAWATVWPIYPALTNDIHFFQVSTNAAPRYFRWHLSSELAPSTPWPGWFNAPHLRDVWGSDVRGDAGDGGSLDLEEMLNVIPLPYTMEDVLSYDTGWKYEVPPRLTNDYWTVSGPLGSFELHHYEEYGEIVWWSDMGDISDYYIELTYFPDYGSWRFIIGPDPFSPIYEHQTYAEKESEYLELGYYHAQHIQLYADTDDYVHWTNMTRRLDWQRLGIICQLERQMELTYLPRQEEDQLPFVATEAHRSFVYEGNKADIPLIHYLDAEYNWHIETTNFNAYGVSWSLVTQSVDLATNKLEMCYPTARTGPGLQFGEIKADFPATLPVYRPASDYRDILKQAIESAVLSEGFTNGTVEISLQGSLYIISAAYQDGSTYGFIVHLDFQANGGTFTPASGEPQYFYYPDNYPTSFFVPGLEPTNIFVHLEMGIGRLATSSFTDGIVNNATPSDLYPVDRESIVTNFVAYPLEPTWDDGWVAWQDRPTLDFMIDTTNAVVLGELNPYDVAPLTWAGIGSASNMARRVFRMSPYNVPQETKYNSDSNRLKMLLELDREVKSRFQALAGVPVQRAAEILSNFQPGEEVSIKDDLERANLQVGFSLDPYCGRHAWVQVAASGSAIVDEQGRVDNLSSISLEFIYYDDGDQDLTYVPVPEENNNYIFVAWLSSGSYASSTNLPSFVPVRVDGHQDQMIKTLWKFKNLRDPNL